MKKLVFYFFQGVLIVAPLAVTVFIIYKLFFAIDDLFKDWMPIYFPGAGLIGMFAFLTLLGFFGRFIIGQPLVRLIDSLLEKAPFIKLIYSSVKDLMSAFVGQKKKFDHPVLVRISNIYDIEKIGFVTRKDLEEIGITGKKVAVYFPHSYAWSGELFIVPVENITELELSSSEAMKFIITGGITK